MALANYCIVLREAFSLYLYARRCNHAFPSFIALARYHLQTALFRFLNLDTFTVLALYLYCCFFDVGEQKMRNNLVKCPQRVVATYDGIHLVSNAGQRTLIVWTRCFLVCWCNEIAVVVFCSMPGLTTMLDKRCTSFPTLIKSYLHTSYAFPCIYLISLHVQNLNLVLNVTLIPQLDELLYRLIKRYNDTSLLCLLVVTVPPVNSPSLLFLGTDDHDEVIKCKLCCADLLLHGVAADIDIGMKVMFAECSLHFLDVVVGAWHDRNDHDLARREPERPSTGKVLCEDTSLVSKDTCYLNDSSTYAMNRSKDP
jgi:hypothetical protein